MKLLLAILLLAMPAMAVDVPFAWDASASPSTPENPILYRFYTCDSVALTTCIKTDVGQTLTWIEPLPIGTSYVYVTALQYTIMGDGKVSGPIAESDKSNVMKVEIKSPPGNPKNIRIKVN